MPSHKSEDYKITAVKYHLECVSIIIHMCFFALYLLTYSFCLSVFISIYNIRYFFDSAFYTFSHLKRPFYRTKNKKICKINFDGLTFSSSLLLLKK